MEIADLSQPKSFKSDLDEVADLLEALDNAEDKPAIEALDAAVGEPAHTNPGADYNQDGFISPAEQEAADEAELAPGGNDNGVIDTQEEADYVNVAGLERDEEIAEL